MRLRSTSNCTANDDCMSADIKALTISLQWKDHQLSSFIHLIIRDSTVGNTIFHSTSRCAATSRSLFESSRASCWKYFMLNLPKCNCTWLQLIIILQVLTHFETSWAILKLMGKVLCHGSFIVKQQDHFHLCEFNMHPVIPLYSGSLPPIEISNLANIFAA